MNIYKNRMIIFEFLLIFVQRPVILIVRKR